MSEAPKQEATFDINLTVEAIMSAVDQEREREIITRRFGLYDRKETLEQIGELLGITRERVRQLEKPSSSVSKSPPKKAKSLKSRQ